VFLNGIPTPVSFNDGDSFRVLGGPHHGTRARLAGFNTLESYGDVHRWGGWEKKELYHLAKLATLNARRGVWHCETDDFERDGYGRLLLWCKDLAVDQVRRGLAHAMTVTLEAAHPDVLAAQAEAIRERRGIWAHGVPEYVLTSLHSTMEGGGFSGRTYNRLVSTRDGHSAKWYHDDAYEECSTVCSKERPVDSASIEAGVAALRADPEVSPIVAALKSEALRNLVGDFARLGFFWGLEDEADRAKVRAALERLDAAGTFGRAPREEGACVVYVEFLRRYGQGRAACLD
jgi:endonuclease YncB( thermonuclease family)